MIRIENLSCTLGNKKVLKNINININENEIIAVVGANGSGKTTLIKSIMSMYKYDGNIFVDDINVAKIKHKQRARLMSYLPQNCLRTNIKVSTLIKHSRFPYLEFGEALSNKDYEVIEEAIELTGIKSILHKNVMDISGGERQLAYLTMVLAQQTPILVMDEPNTFLDISHQIFLNEVIKKLKENGKTIIVVLHNIVNALEIADKIVVINNGTLYDYGKVDDVKNSIEDVFGVRVSEIKLLENQNDVPLYKYSLVKTFPKN